jgi:hypothetical protein
MDTLVDAESDPDRVDLSSSRALKETFRNMPFGVLRFDGLLVNDEASDIAGSTVNGSEVCKAVCSRLFDTEPGEFTQG